MLEISRRYSAIQIGVLHDEKEVRNSESCNKKIKDQVRSS